MSYFVRAAGDRVAAPRARENNKARGEWISRAGALLGLVALGTIGWADERAAVKEILRLGGEVVRDEKVAGEPVVLVQLPRREIGDADLKVLKEFGNSRGLNLNAANITDAGLKELKGITTLEFLALENTKVTDAGLKELKQLKRLKVLYLIGTPITDAGLKDLKEFKDLEELYIESTKITDAGLNRLKEVKSLRKLDVFDTKVTDAGVKELTAALPGLKVIR